MTSPRSGLIVEIPHAEPVVRRHRELLDTSAKLGVPAHITVLFPFLPPAMIDDDVLTALRDLFATARGFEYRLDRAEWFGDAVLWLAPRDAGPFRALTQLVFEAYPDFPPYEGEFDDVVPHLTVGHGQPLDELRTAEQSVKTRLPIAGHASAVTLMTQETAEGRWTRTAGFALGQ